MSGFLMPRRLGVGSSTKAELFQYALQPAGGVCKRILLLAIALVTIGAVSKGAAAGNPHTKTSDPTRDAEWMAKVQSRLTHGQYAIRFVAGGMHARSRAQGLQAHFGERTGASVTPCAGGGKSKLEIRLVGWGRDSRLESAWDQEPMLGECGETEVLDERGDCLRRMEYVRLGITEWWQSSLRGLEQGFRIDAEPPGRGRLVLELDMRGMQSELTDDGGVVELTSETGARLQYSGLAARDANGTKLAAHFEYSSTGVRLVASVSDAEFPVNIGSILTSPAWIVEGNQANADLGWSAASAGDVNGDGYGDVIVGALNYSGGETKEGRAFVYLGSPSGLSTTAAWFAESNQAGAAFGMAVASAGDINGDGFGDVIIGAPDYDNGQTNEGRAFVYLGSASGLGPEAAWTAESNQSRSGFGLSVGSAGDVNGDGYGDVIVGSPDHNNGEIYAGSVFVYLGSSTGLSMSAAWTAEGDEDGAYFGGSVASAGDVNGDGYGDVIVGAPVVVNDSSSGAAFVYLGSSSGLAASPVWNGRGSTWASSYGGSVASAGDVNGDGYGDVVIGAPGGSNGERNEGRAYLYLGHASGLGASAAWTAESDQANAKLGLSVGSAGDVNGDGYGDVIVGAPYYVSGGEMMGRAFIYLGSSSGVRPTAFWTVGGSQAGARFGYVSISAGDTNGDGYGDVILGAPLYSNGQNQEGRVLVFNGSASGLGNSADWAVEGNRLNASLGYSLASAGDVNGDGYGDVIVGAPDYGAFVYLGSESGLGTAAVWESASDQNGGEYGASVASAGDINGDGYGDVIVGEFLYDIAGGDDAGRVYVYYGSASGLASVPAWIGDGQQDVAWFGYSVGSAGDVNGDGYGDIIVGAPLQTNGLGNEGSAYVYLGSPSGLESEAAWTGESEQAGALFGYSVAAAGDVNGDGYGDVIVGARSYDGGQEDEGRASVFLGSASGLSASAAWVVGGNQAQAEFGYSVASAGDVNGDGYGDIVVGAPGYSNGQAAEGRAFVYHGSSSGPEPVAGWAADGNQVQAWFGVAVASGGDVNGDGYGDIVIGATGYDNNWTSEGRAFVYLGSESGLGTGVVWTADGGQAQARLGGSVGSAGDVNGDGYSDVIVGADGYDNGEAGEGRALVFLGNNGDGTTAARANRTQARRTDSGAPIQPYNWTGSDDSFRVAAIARPYTGRGKVKLEIEAKPLGVPFDGAGLLSSASWADSGVAGVELEEEFEGFGAGTAYHWRARVLHDAAQGAPQLWSHWNWGGVAGHSQGVHLRIGCGYTWFRDADGDGRGNPADIVQSCQAPAGYVSDNTDCDDANPGCTSDCTDADGDGVCVGHDCDDSSDTGSVCTTNCLVSYRDSDGDAFGDPAVAAVACVLPEGFVTDNTDCNDENPNVYPDADEICNGVDDDCSAVADDDPVDAGVRCEEAGAGTCSAPGIGFTACQAGEIVCVVSEFAVPHFSWSAVPGASHYVVQMDYKGRRYDWQLTSPGSVSVAQPWGETAEFRSAVRFRVRAVDSNGRGGYWSPWQGSAGTISYAGCAAAPASYSYAVGIGYDSLGRVDEITHPTAAAASQVYTYAQGAGQETLSYSRNVVISSASYGRMGELEGMSISRYAGSASLALGSTSRSYDRLGRPLGDLTSFDRGSVVAYRVNYTGYGDDGWGFLESGTRTTLAAGAVGFSFNYGDFGELDWAKYGNETIDYDYDLQGNLTSHGGHAAAGLTVPAFPGRAFDSGNHDPNFDYDSAGRMVNNGSHEFSYNSLDRVAKVDERGATVVEYYYDGDGHRVGAYDGERLRFSVRDLANNVVSTVTFGYDTSNCWTRVEERDLNYFNGDVVMAATTAGGQTTRQYIVRDPWHSPVAILDERNEFAVEERWYSPYGYEMLGTSSSSVVHGFAGYEEDVATGLGYARARYLIPLNGRFNRPDPAFALDLRNPYGLNLYSYAFANPIALRDPYGLKTVLEWINDRGVIAAEQGSTLAVSGWAIGGAVWTLFGYEGVSTVADKLGSDGRELEASDVLVAGLELATLGKGGGLVGAGVKKVGKKVLEKAAAEKLTRAVVKFGAKMVASDAGRFLGKVCFAAGTLVQTEHGNVPIESIQAGDKVWSLDRQTGEHAWSTVDDLFVTEGQDVFEYLLCSATDDCEALVATPSHPVWSGGGWVGIGSLLPGEEVWTAEGWRGVYWNADAGTETVYNLEVAGTHTYFVGEVGVWVHNGCLNGMPLSEAKQLVGRWGKGTYETVAESIRDHAFRHGFGSDIPKYLRKAANFNKRGATKTILEDGATRWNRTNGEFLIERAGKIVSYGINP